MDIDKDFSTMSARLKQWSSGTHRERNKAQVMDKKDQLGVYPS